VDAGLLLYKQRILKSIILQKASLAHMMLKHFFKEAAIRQPLYYINTSSC
jgi:hypothetical protein